jgi:hypothetical protein
MSQPPMAAVPMADGRSRQAGRLRRNVLFARALVAANLGALLGFFVWLSAQSEARRGVKLTLAEYTANFESYRTELLDGGKLPLVGFAIFTAICALLAAGVYEVLARGLLVLITRTRLGRFISPWGATPAAEASGGGVRAGGSEGA